MRTRMVDKRWRKMEPLQGSEGLDADVEEGAEMALVGWGSTYGAIREAVIQLRARGKKISHIQLWRLWPFPAQELTGLLKRHKEIITVENNSMGQMARLMRMETGIHAHDQILKYDGRPISPSHILTHVS